MVNPKITNILLVLFLIWIASKSSYRKPALTLLTVLVIYLALKMFVLRYRRQPDRKKASEATGLIENGDLIHICSVKDAIPFLDPFNLVCMFSNEEEVHTAYAVRYQSKLYVLNSYATFLFNRRKPYYKDPNSVIVLESNKIVTFFMEPLEEFLGVESNLNSYLKIVKTEKKPTEFDMNQKKLFQKLAGEWWEIHCCKALGKYLESQGLSENRSGYTDFLYYFPDVLRKNLKATSEQLIQLI